jgi:hypothetical protein
MLKVIKNCNLFEPFSDKLVPAPVQISFSWIFEPGNALDFVRLVRCRLRTKTNFAREP